jgi:5-methylcytosine-specific restriction endonuclease McrA
MASKKGDPRLSRKYKEVRLKKLAMDGWVCFYCGYEGKDMTIDHVIPVSKAPELAIDINNMVSACKPCNSAKGCKTPEEARMPLLYVPYAPSVFEKMILKNRKILADQMEFLLARVPKNSRLHQAA